MKLSLGKRLTFMTMMLLLPLTVLVIFLIGSLMLFTDAYEQTVSNIAEVNSYVITFRDDIDYTVYREKIGSMTYAQIYDLPEEERPYGWEQLINPYEQIAEAKKTFEELLKNTRQDDSKHVIEWILHTLILLEDSVLKIDQGIENGQPYSEINTVYDLEFKVLISDVQDKLQDYIYIETLHMNRIQDDLRTRGQRAIQISAILLVVMVIAGLLVARLITRSITRPIKQLNKATERVARGDFKSTEVIESSGEIGILASSFHNMQEEIGILIENIKGEQNQRKIIELQLLQEQINPHFLYNTLDTIVWLAEGEQNKEVVKMVTALSDFFRSALSGGRDYVPISEETKHITSYLEIQRIRYQDILDYRISIDKEIKSFPILKLTLQPIVENALYHGIKHKREKGMILVKGYRSGDDVVFEVSDDGKGMTENEVEDLLKGIRGEQSTSKSGFGLANVEKRLHLNYGEAYRLQFQSTFGEGTTFFVRIPIENEIIN